MAETNDPTFEELVDLAADPSSSPNLSGAAARTFRQLRLVLAALGRAGAVPATTLQRAIELPGLLTERRGVDGRSRTLGIAALVADSRGEALLGYRGQTSAYHLTFEVEGIEIGLEVQPDERDGERLTLRGFIDRTDDAGTAGRVIVSGLADDAPIAEATIDDAGYFSVTLAPGTYDLAIELKDTTLVLPAVEVG